MDLTPKYGFQKPALDDLLWNEPTNENWDLTELLISGTEALASGTQSALTSHIIDTSDAHSATAISYDNGASGLIATTTQGAVDELTGLIDDLTDDLTAHNHNADYLRLDGGIVSGTTIFNGNFGQVRLGGTAGQGGKLSIWKADGSGEMASLGTANATDSSMLYFRSNVGITFTANGSVNFQPNGRQNVRITGNDFIAGGPVTYTTPSHVFNSYGTAKFYKVPRPAAPTSIVQVGTPGSMTYYYWVAAADSRGNLTELSPASVTNTSNSILSGSNYNTITWAAVSGSTQYHVYRTTTPTPPSGTGLFRVGIVGSATINDTSNTLGNVVIPTRNTTGDIVFEGPIQAESLAGDGSLVTNVDAATLNGLSDIDFEVLTNKGQANGYASLDGSGRVPAGQLPTPAPSGIQEINGLSGTSVSLDTDDVVEGSTNLYWTDGRFDARLASSAVDAETLDGLNSSDFALTGHDHDGAYSPIGHDHTGVYSPAGHNHDSAYATKSLETDVSVISGTVAAHTIDIAGLTSDISDLETEVAGKQNTLGYTPENQANRGIAGGYAPLGLDGKVPVSNLPAIAINDTFVVSGTSAMIALTAERGDVAVRTDINKSFILKTDDASLEANWQELLTPTDAVLTVNGQSGNVILTTTNIAEGSNLYYTTSRVQTDGDARYLRLAGGTLTGKLITPASSTGSAGFNVPAGTAPTSPVSGDMWQNGVNLFFRTALSTRTILHDSSSLTATLLTGTIDNARLASNVVLTTNSNTFTQAQNIIQSDGSNTGLFNVFNTSTSSLAAAKINFGLEISGTSNTKGSIRLAKAPTGADTKFIFTTNVGGSLTDQLSLDATSGLVSSVIIVAPASTTTRAGLRITQGVAPAAPVNGDTWTTASDLLVHITGATQTVEFRSNKGVANGYASLGADGLVPLAQLPAAATGGVQSINGISGTTIELTADDVPEGLSNLYWSQLKFNQALNDSDLDSAYAPLNHNHDGVYATVVHNHNASYADINHDHDTVYRKKTDTAFVEMFAVADLATVTPGEVVDYKVISGGAKNIGKVVISSLSTPVSGGIEIDIKIKATPGSAATSIFSTKPVLTGVGGINWMNVTANISTATIPDDAMVILEVTDADGGQDLRVEIYE